MSGAHCNSNMSDYQRKRNNKYILPTAVYHQTLWLIRDYDRMMQELNDIMLESPAPPDGMPRGTSKVSEAQVKAERRAPILAKTNAIEKAMKRVPKEYRRGVWNNIQAREAFPRDADRSTYAKWKSRFIHDVAVALGMIPENW